MKKLITNDRCILEKLCDGVYRLVYGRHPEQTIDGLVMLDDEKGFVRCWEYLDLARIGDKRRAKKLADPMNGVFFEQVLRELVLQRGYSSVLSIDYYKKK